MAKVGRATGCGAAAGAADPVAALASELSVASVKTSCAGCCCDSYVLMFHVGWHVAALHSLQAAADGICSTCVLGLLVSSTCGKPAPVTHKRFLLLVRTFCLSCCRS